MATPKLSWHQNLSIQGWKLLFRRSSETESTAGHVSICEDCEWEDKTGYYLQPISRRIIIISPQLYLSILATINELSGPNGWPWEMLEMVSYLFSSEKGKRSVYLQVFNMDNSTGTSTSEWLYFPADYFLFLFFLQVRHSKYVHWDSYINILFFILVQHSKIYS